MTGLMTCLGGMSIQASVIICVILLIRKIFLMAHISKKYILLLWMIPFFFLVFPWKIASPVGFWSHAPADYGTKDIGQQVVRNEGGQNEGRQDVRPAKPVEKVKQEHIQEQEAAPVQKDSDDVQENTFSVKKDDAQAEKEADFLGDGADVFSKSFSNLPYVCGMVWLAGIVFLGVYSIFSYVRLQGTVCCSVNRNGNVYYADGIQVPMVLGIFRARIYIPSGIEEKHLEYVIAHERTHIRRKDFITKVIAWFILCIHWFNPLVWAAYGFMVKDMEMACDEETVQRIGMEKKGEYAGALLQVSAGKRKMFAVPLAFGEGDTKKRIKNVMRYQKNVKITAVIAIAAAVVTALVFLTKTDEGNASENVNVTVDKRQTASGWDMAGGQADKNTGRSGELTLKMVRDAFENRTIDKMDFHDYTNGKEDMITEDALNYYIHFFYEYKGEEYRFSTSHSKKTNLLEDIYITRISDSEQAWLYTADDEAEKYPGDLDTFFSTKREIEDWLTLELPKGYTLGSYQAGLGEGGGALISPKAYEPEGDAGEWTPAEWQYSGFVGRIPNADERFSFIDGKLDGEYYIGMNHTTAKVIAVLDDMALPVIFARYNHDLYTAADMGKLEEQGIEPQETTSDYWYFFFVREGEEEAYYLTLSTKMFSKEEALAVAGTVKIKG